MVSGYFINAPASQDDLAVAVAELKEAMNEGLFPRSDAIAARFETLEQRQNEMGKTAQKLKRALNQMALASSPPRQRLPELEKLKKDVQVPSWIASAKGKLEVDGEAIGDNKAQFFYLRARVGDDYKALLLGQLQAAQEAPGNDPALWDPWKVFTTLDHVYGGALEKERARQKLGMMNRMAFVSFGRFLGTWLSLLFQAGLGDLPDAEKIRKLREVLPPKLQSRIFRSATDWRQTPTDFNDFVVMVHRLSEEEEEKRQASEEEDEEDEVEEEVEYEEEEEEYWEEEQHLVTARGRRNR